MNNQGPESRFPDHIAQIKEIMKAHPEWDEEEASLISQYERGAISIDECTEAWDEYQSSKEFDSENYFPKE